MLIMFAIAIPLGMARENKGVAAFTGFVGFTVFHLGINFYLTTTGILLTTDPTILKANNIQNILGIQSIDTGILGTVIVGIIVYLLHERCNTIRLPDALAFFGGVRFVPIITTLILIPVVVVIWFVTYYIIFRFAIIRFNIKTPEREIDNNHKVNRFLSITNKSDYDIPAMLAALGGKDNIVITG